MATWVKTGTVSVTQDSTAVTGVGTSFSVEGRVGDGFVGPDERLYEVVNIVSDTQLTLGKPYAGVTGVDQPYAMIPIQGYLQRSADALRMYSEEAKDLVESPTITALAAAVMAANKMLYWTGAGSLATIDSTAYGRALLGLTNATALKGAAGLANVDNTSDANKPISTATQTALNGKQASNANLTALAGLTLAADRLPYATGAGAMALTTFTAYARSLLDDADAAAMRTTLGLGTSATSDLTTSSLDTIAGRALKVGDFGLGSLSGVTVAQALLNDNSLAGGIYRCDIAAGGYQGLLQAPHGLWQNRLNNSGATTQIAIHYNAHRLFFRGINTGDFQEALRRSDVVGAVSSAANAGAVIERGSNANGEYVRYADGTQICWGVAADALLCTAAVGNGFQSPGTSNFTFPIGFVSAPRVSPGGYFPSGGSSRAWPNMAVVGSGSCTIVAHGFTSSATIQVAYIAVGRWY